MKDPFVESLTHDSIIVQIPHLKGRTRNRLEHLLKAGVAPDVRTASPYRFGYS